MHGTSIREWADRQVRRDSKRIREHGREVKRNVEGDRRPTCQRREFREIQSRMPAVDVRGS